MAKAAEPRTPFCLLGHLGHFKSSKTIRTRGLPKGYGSQAIDLGLMPQLPRQWLHAACAAAPAGRRLRVLHWMLVSHNEIPSVQPCWTWNTCSGPHATSMILGWPAARACDTFGVDGVMVV